MDNGVGEVHVKAIKREAENGVKSENGVDSENGEPAVKIKKEGKSNLCFFLTSVSDSYWAWSLWCVYGLGIIINMLQV